MIVYAEDSKDQQQQQKRNQKKTNLKPPRTNRWLLGAGCMTVLIYKSQLLSYIITKDNGNLKLKTQHQLY